MLAPLIKPSSVGSYCKVWIMKWCNSVTLYKVALHYCDTIQGDRSLQPLTTDSGTQINRGQELRHRTTVGRGKHQ